MKYKFEQYLEVGCGGTLIPKYISLLVYLSVLRYISHLPAFIKVPRDFVGTEDSDVLWGFHGIKQ